MLWQVHHGFEICDSIECKAESTQAMVPAAHESQVACAVIHYEVSPHPKTSMHPQCVSLHVVHVELLLSISWICAKHPSHESDRDAKLPKQMCQVNSPYAVPNSSQFPYHIELYLILQ